MTPARPMPDRGTSGARAPRRGVGVPEHRAGRAARRIGGALALFVAALLVAAAWLPGATPVEAHAELVRASPSPGSALADPPEAIEIWFSEPLESQFSGLELLDGTGVRIELQAVAIGVDDGRRMVGHMPALAPGVYTVVYRALSRRDGHFLTGSYSFTVLGPGVAAGGAAAFEPSLSSGAGPEATIGRWALLVGLAALAGGGAVAFAAARSDRSPEGVVRRLAWRSYLPLAAAGLALALVGDALLLRAQHAAIGGSLTTLLTESRFGLFLLWRVGLLAAVALVGLGLWRRGAREGWPAAAALVGLGAIYTVSAVSHAAAAPGSFWALATDLVHLATAMLWLGGIGFLGLLALRARGPGGRPPAETLLRLVAWFSVAAAVSLLLLTATGLLRAFGELPSLEALTGTNYGRWLIAKLALIAPLLAVAWLNRRVVGRWLRGAMEAEAALARLRALLPAEALLGVVVLLSVAALGQASTPRAGAAGAGLELSRFASPAPQLSTEALLGGVLAVAAASALLALRYLAPARARPGWAQARAASALAAALLVVAAGGLSEPRVQRSGAAAAQQSLAFELTPAPGTDCNAIAPGANLAGCDLSGRDLSGVDLREANLTGANLEGTNLLGARMQGATLLGANLQGADLTASYLQEAILSGADLRGANLRGANAVGALLGGALLGGANLTGADLAHAYLADADLDGAVVSGTTLTDADLSRVNWANTICPEGPEAIPGGIEICAGED